MSKGLVHDERVKEKAKFFFIYIINFFAHEIVKKKVCKTMLIPPIEAAESTYHQWNWWKVLTIYH